MNFAEILTASAAAHPDRPAVCLGPERVTYAELYDRALRIASALRERGHEAGSVVAVMLQNGPEFVAAYFGVLLAGSVVTAVNPLLTPGEVDRLLENAGARTLIGGDPERPPAPGVTRIDPADAAAAEPLKEPVPRADDDTALLLYSSGTTSGPKAAEMTHHNLVWSSDAMVAAVGAPSAALCVAPFFQGFGQGCGMNGMLRAGATIHTQERWNAAAALDTLEHERVPLLQAVPAMCHDLLELPDVHERDRSALQLCMTGGAATPLDLLKRFEHEFDCEVLEGYGVTEALRVSMNRPGRRRAGSIGVLLEGVEHRFVDSAGDDVVDGAGELVIRGPNVMRGYWGQPEATAEVLRDGWLYTRDLSYEDEDGFLWVIGRVDDLISRGGYKVHPVEVERLLAEHPAVAEAAVIALPDERLGSEIGAAVVVAEGHELDTEELREFMRERVAKWKYPRRIWAVPSLPRGITGKLLRREVAPPTPDEDPAASR
ncbi:MAG TPA: AMP-binding protein [Thermoleophilaceae bacterium]|jgi:long-chain acyl-CoA synthetase